MFESFHAVVSDVAGSVRKHEKEMDRPVIGVMPAYFPMELIEAAGGYPVQLWGNNLPITKADAHLQGFCCSVARSILELELIGGADMVKAYAFTSLCDTLVNLKEIYSRLFTKPAVQLSMPITQSQEARHTYLERVLNGITTGLEEITGNKITPESLKAAAQLHGHTRKLQRELYQIRRDKPGLIKNYDFYTVIKAGFFLPRAVYSKQLEDLLANLKTLDAPEGKRIKIINSGLVFDPMAIYPIFDELNADIVDDDFANGWRSVSKTELNTDNLVEGVTDYLFGPSPCCCLYNPDNDRHDYLVEKAKKTEADGVLFWYMNFCEPDAFDIPQLKARLKEEGIPTVSIDVELTMTNLDAVKTRINAFCEMVEG
jgi:bcr-type benzoyl-CoA reductase subunit C